MSSLSLLEKTGHSSQRSCGFRPAQAARAVQVAAAPVNPAMPDLRCDWSLTPKLPSPGQARNLFKLQDELLTHYGEEYLSFIAPWKHLVGAELPNFLQFIEWHEQPTRPGKALAGKLS